MSDRIGDLIAWRNQNGQRWPVRGGNDVEASLARWLERARSGAGPVIAGRLDNHASGWRSSGKTARRHEPAVVVVCSPGESWPTRCDQLRRYWEGNGQWPNRHRDGILGRWVETQRIQLRKERLSEPRRALLDEIDPDWWYGSHHRGELSFDEGLVELDAFRDRHPDRWPSPSRDGRLATWFATLDPETLTSPERRQIDQLGDWVKTHAERHAEMRLDRIRSFVAEYERFPHTGDAGSWAQDGQWLSHKRRQFDDGTLDVQVVASLNRIGDWLDTRSRRRRG